MLESRWERRAATGVAAIGAMLAIASATAGAPVAAGRPPPVCDPPTAVSGPTAAGSPAWHRLDPEIADGTLVGQRLEVGRGDGAAWSISLDAESFATGPTLGRVVVGSDDGRRSTVSVVDTSRGCIAPIATMSDAVIRRALLEPDGRGIVEHRIRRSDRADLGIWRRPFGPETPTRLLGPMGADAVFGRTWSTDLAWSDDGRSLAVSTCGEVACRTRVLTLATAEIRSIRDPGHGTLVGLADDQLVVRAACRGLPCPVLAVDLRDGTERVLADAAGLAVVVDTLDGSATVVHDAGADPTLQVVPLDDGAERSSLPLDDGRGLLSPHGGSGVELPPGWFGLGHDGRLPDRPAIDARVERLADGSIRRLDEVSP
jgi:hypothetical protein